VGPHDRGLEPTGDRAARRSAPRHRAVSQAGRQDGLDEPYSQESDEQRIRSALGTRHEFLRGITYERLLEEGWAPLAIPEPWMPLAEGKYPTASGKWELYSQALADRGIDPLPY